MDTEAKDGFYKSASQVKSHWAKLLIYGQTAIIVVIFPLFLTTQQARISEKTKAANDCEDDKNKSLAAKDRIIDRKDIIIDSLQNLRFIEKSESVDELKKIYGNGKK